MPSIHVTILLITFQDPLWPGCVGLACFRLRGSSVAPILLIFPSHPFIKSQGGSACPELEDSPKRSSPWVPQGMTVQLCICDTLISSLPSGLARNF